MFARVLGCAVLCLSLFALGIEGGEKAAKDKKDVGKEAKKADAKGTKEVAGKLKSVSVEKLSLTVAPEGGKEQTFKVTDDTKFVGPQGGKRGTGKKGLTDDVLVPGAMIRVVPAASDAGTASEVHLPKKASEKKKKA